VDLEYDPETRRFAARVLREVADMLEGDEDEGGFIERWREYERARRNGDSRMIEDDGDSVA
jgi:hypothetical protein